MKSGYKFTKVPTKTSKIADTEPWAMCAKYEGRGQGEGDEEYQNMSSYVIQEDRCKNRYAMTRN